MGSSSIPLPQEFADEATILGLACSPVANTGREVLDKETGNRWRCWNPDGSGYEWSRINTANEVENVYLTVIAAELPAVPIVPFPAAGKITRFTVVNGGVPGGFAPPTYDLRIGLVPVTDGLLTFPTGTPAFTVVSTVPTANNVLLADDPIIIISLGTFGGPNFSVGFTITVELS